MRTIRSSSRFPERAVCTWGGVSAPGGSALGGCLLLGAICSWRVYALGGGVCSWRGYPSMHWGRTPPLWTDRHLWKYNLRNFVADGNDVWRISVKQAKVAVTVSQILFCYAMNWSLFGFQLVLSGLFLPTGREGYIFTGVCHSVHNRPYGQSVTYSAVGTHPTGILFCL